MPKKDDCTLLPDDYEKVRREARQILITANAIGRFPTPVADIMSVAMVKVVDDNILDEGFLTGIRRKAGKALKRAISKTLGLLDVKSQFVFIDKTVHTVRQTFIKIHEAAHFVMAWQRKLFLIVEDCEKTISPEIEDYFDREANVFTSEVLFQLDTFTKEAADYSFGLKVPLQLSKKYGASIYSTIRRYVSKNSRACVVLILDPPEFEDGYGFQASLRRVVASEKFIELFGTINWPNKFTPDDEIGAMIPIAKRRMSGPREVGIKNRNGELCECIGEAFTQSYQVFILIHAVKAF
jgi:Zn-dependent peptidase ImmA (M78 family)